MATRGLVCGRVRVHNAPSTEKWSQPVVANARPFPAASITRTPAAASVIAPIRVTGSARGACRRARNRGALRRDGRQHLIVLAAGEEICEFSWPRTRRAPAPPPTTARASASIWPADARGAAHAAEILHQPVGDVHGRRGARRARRGRAPSAAPAAGGAPRAGSGRREKGASARPERDRAAGRAPALHRRWCPTRRRDRRAARSPGAPCVPSAPCRTR